MVKLLENKIFKICSSIIEWFIIIVLVLLIILVGFQKFSNQGNFFGYRIYTIISGSMIPTYDIGDTLLIKEMSADNIEIGDAVTYLGDGGSYNGKIITHQVVDIEFDEDGKYLFHTKGVANNIEDPIVSQDQVLGKVVHKFFFLTLLGRVTTSMSLLFTFVTIPLAIIIALEIVKLVYKQDEQIEEEVKEELEELNEEMAEEIKEIEKEEIEEIVNNSDLESIIDDKQEQKNENNDTINVENDKDKIEVEDSKEEKKESKKTSDKKK